MSLVIHDLGGLSLTKDIEVLLVALILGVAEFFAGLVDRHADLHATVFAKHRQFVFTTSLLGVQAR